MSRGGPDLEIGPRAGVSPAPFFVHLFRALFLSRDFYERVAADDSATRQAVAVVCLAALAYGGTLMPVSPTVEQLARSIGYWLLVLLMAITSKFAANAGYPRSFGSGLSPLRRTVLGEALRLARRGTHR